MKLLKIDLDEITLLFIGLKLSGHVQWRWYFVLSPSILAIIARVIIALYKKKKED